MTLEQLKKSWRSFWDSIAWPPVWMTPERIRPDVNYITGDVEIIWEDVPMYYEYINDALSVIRADDGDRIIGVNISRESINKAEKENEQSIDL